MQPLVTVIIPTYNNGIYVRDCLDSILSGSQISLEVVAINDASTDDTATILDSYARRDRRIRIITNQTRIGAPTSFNNAVSLARGNFIARCDSDDICLPGRLQIQLSQILDVDGDLIGSPCLTGREPNTVKHVEAPLDDNQLIMRLLSGPPFAHSTIMARREVFENVPYSTTVHYADDHDFIWRVFTAGYKIGSTKAAGIFYRRHRRQISRIFHINQIRESNEIRNRYLPFLFSRYKWNAMGVPHTGNVMGLVPMLDSQWFRRSCLSLARQSWLMGNFLDAVRTIGQIKRST